MKPISPFDFTMGEKWRARSFMFSIETDSLKREKKNNKRENRKWLKSRERKNIKRNLSPRIPEL